MLMTQSISEINVLLLRQLSSFFVLSEDDKKAVEQSVPCALDKCERSFSKSRNTALAMLMFLTAKRRFRLD